MYCIGKESVFLKESLSYGFCRKGFTVDVTTFLEVLLVFHRNVCEVSGKVFRKHDPKVTGKIIVEVVL